MKVSFPMKAEANFNQYSVTDQTAGYNNQQRLPSDEELKEIERQRKEDEEKLAKEKEAAEKAKKKKKDAPEDGGDVGDKDGDSDADDDGSDDEGEGDEEGDDEAGDEDTEGEEEDEESGDGEDEEGDDEEEDEESTSSAIRYREPAVAKSLHVAEDSYTRKRIPRNVSEAAAMSDIRIISGFPGIGKSTLFKEYPDITRDSDSSTFPKEDFPNNYIQHIRETLEDQNVRHLLVSSHFPVRDELEEQGFPFYLVYPDRELKDEYLKRYTDRGSPEAFVKLLDDNWNDWISSCQSQAGCIHVVLKSGQYLSDVFKG